MDFDRGVSTRKILALLYTLAQLLLRQRQLVVSVVQEEVDILYVKIRPFLVSKFTVLPLRLEQVFYLLLWKLLDWFVPARVSRALFGAKLDLYFHEGSLNGIDLIGLENPF